MPYSYHSTLSMATTMPVLIFTIAAWAAQQAHNFEADASASQTPLQPWKAWMTQALLRRPSKHLRLAMAWTLMRCMPRPRLLSRSIMGATWAAWEILLSQLPGSLTLWATRSQLRSKAQACQVCPYCLHG